VAICAKDVVRALDRACRHTAARANPPHPTCRVTDDKRVVFNWLHDHGARPDHRPTADLVSAHNCCAGADRCASVDNSGHNLPLRADRARVSVVGEHSTRSDQHFVFDRHPSVDRYIVLDLGPGTDSRLGVDEYVLANRASFSDDCAGTNVRVMPHVRPTTDRCARFNESGLVSRKLGGVWGHLR
jgi:hypothetical protein